MKITIETDEIIIRSILDITDGEINTPPIMQTNVRNLIMATARNELIVVQCKHASINTDIFVLCAHVTDNPALGERLLPICTIPHDNAWIAGLRPPPNIPKSAFVTPMPSEPFEMIPVEDLTDAEAAVREQRQQEVEEEAASRLANEDTNDDDNRQADESTIYDRTGKPIIN